MAAKKRSRKGKRKGLASKSLTKRVRRLEILTKGLAKARILAKREASLSSKYD